MSAASTLPTSPSTTAAGTARFNAEAAAWDLNPFVHKASQHACEAILARLPALFPSSSSSSSTSSNATTEPSLDILEIGCGTGLLTFLLAPHARSITAVDASPGMVEVLRRKIEAKKAGDAGAGAESSHGNVTGVCVLLEDPEDEALPPARDEVDGGGAGGARGKRMKYDLVVSHLVLHHIPDLEGVLRTMKECLKDDGWVALTDFEDEGPQSRAFHPKSKMEGVARDGIPRVKMEELMRAVGFKDVRVEVGWSMEKRVERWEGEFGSRGKGEEGEGVVREFPFVVCLGRR